MATTNDPLEGGPTPSPNPGADPVKTLAPKEPGAPSHDDHDTSGPPAPEVIARGYEEDVYDTKTVLSVPALVVVFFVLAFGTVTVLFSVIAKPAADPNAHPQAKARNEADLNSRLHRIGRGREVDQPRLEPLRERESRGKADATAITRPEKPGVNSPELHPEDLIPDAKRYPELYQSGGDRVSLDKLLAVDNEGLKGLFKSSAPPLGEDPPYSSYSGSDAGRGAHRGRVVQPEPKAAEVKKEAAPEPKKAGEAPKEAPKKDATPGKDPAPPKTEPAPKKEPGKEGKK